MELVDILMGLLVVSQDPLLSELRIAPWIRANEFGGLVFLMGGQMVRKVLRHFETLQAAWEPALIESHGQVAFKVLAEL